MGCGFSNEKSQRNLSNKDIINILDDTQSKLSNDKKSYFSPTMGTSQSKRSNKISKFRSSSVGAVGEFAEEDESNTNSNNSGKLSSMKGNNFRNSENNKKDSNNSNNGGGNTILQNTSEVSSSQVNFFKMLDEKIENGTELDEEEADRMRKVELSKCVEEWENHVLSKSQSGEITSTKNKIIQAAVASSENNKSSKHAFNKGSDPQKKHCDEPRKLSKENERSKRNLTTSSSNSNTTRSSKETKKSAKENGAFTSSNNTTSNSINLMSDKDNINYVKQDGDNIASSKMSGNLPKSTSRKPKLKPKEDENTSNTSNNGNGTGVVGSRKGSTTAKQDAQKSPVPKSSNIRPSESSTTKSHTIKNSNSKENDENSDVNGKCKASVSSSSKHLKDRGKKIN